MDRYHREFVVKPGRGIYLIYKVNNFYVHNVGKAVSY